MNAATEGWSRRGTQYGRILCWRDCRSDASLMPSRMLTEKASLAESILLLSFPYTLFKRLVYASDSSKKSFSFQFTIFFNFNFFGCFFNWFYGDFNHLVQREFLLLESYSCSPIQDANPSVIWSFICSQSLLLVHAQKLTQSNK